MDLNLGSQLRRVRESQGLSLRSVASAVGISASALSQVETGVNQPSVATLYALVGHLGVSLDSLIGRSDTPATPFFTAFNSLPSAQTFPVQRAAENPVIQMENGVTWERLASGGSDVADPLVVTYPPGSASSTDHHLMQHRGLEYGWILEGQLTLRIDLDEHSIGRGDSFCFDASRPHLYANYSDEPAKGVWFVISDSRPT